MNVECKGSRKVGNHTGAFCLTKWKSMLIWRIQEGKKKKKRFREKVAECFIHFKFCVWNTHKAPKWRCWEGRPICESRAQEKDQSWQIEKRTKPENVGLPNICKDIIVVSDQNISWLKSTQFSGGERGKEGREEIWEKRERRNVGKHMGEDKRLWIPKSS